MKTQSEHIEKPAEQQQEELREEGLVLDVSLSSIYKISGAGSSDEQNPYANILVNFGKEIGHDFSNVNVYQNAPAANSLGAEAFTEGNSIHLSVAASKYSAAKREDLIRHELVHVVQQRQNRASVSNRLELEKEAENPTRYAARLRQPTSKRERQRVKQFRYYEITAEEIKKIRQFLAVGKGLEVYKFIRKKIKGDFARTKFLADYKDIGFGLLETLKAQNKEEEWTEVSNLFYIPAKGIDPASAAALSVFKTEQGILGIEEIALRHGLTLDDLLDVSNMTMTEVERNPDDFVTALENNFSPAGEKDPSMDALISDLRLYSLIDRVERQAQLKNEPHAVAKNKKYTKYYPGFLHGLHQLRTKNSDRKRKEKMPTLVGLLMRSNTDLKQFKVAGLNLGEFGEVAHWLNFYGVSFGDGAVIDELVLDKVNNRFTIKAKNLPINFLEMANHEGGFYADQINLTDTLITLDLKGNTPAPNPKSPFSLFHNSIRNNETSHAEINMYGNLDVHNLRLVSSESTTGIGRLQIPGLHLNYSQDISERKTFSAKIKNPLIFRALALTSMLMKGPMLLQPLFFGIMNPFVMNMKEATDKDWLEMHRLKTLLNELKGKPHTAKSFQEALTRWPAAEKVSNPQFMAFDAHRKSYQAAFTDMLSENLKLSLNFEEIRLEHFFMTDSKLTPEQAENGRLPYIREIVIGKNTTEDNAPEIELETHPLSAEEIEKALISDLRKELSPAAQEKINAIQRATDKLGAYRLLARESHHARSKTKAKHVATVEAAAYFEFFRKTDFAVHSSSGHIKGGNMVVDLVLPMMTAMAESSGAKITGLSGIENINYKNLEIGILQHAQGWEIAPDKFNGLAIEVEVPHAAAESLEYHAGGIDLTAKDLDLEELTVGVKLTFNEVMAKEPYELSLSAIKIKKAQIADTYFHYPEMDLHFNSARSVADNITFSMTPTTAPESTDLSIERIGLFEAGVNFGSHQVTSTGDEEIVLQGLAFHQDKERLAFSLGGFGMNGSYSDQTGSQVDFDLHQPKDNGLPFFGYEKQANGNQRIKLRHDGLIRLPVFSFYLAPDQNLEIKEAEIGGINLDLELEGDDVLLHVASIQTICGEGVNYTDKERTVSTDQPITLNGLLLQNIRISALEESAVSLNKLNWNAQPSYQAEPVKNYVHNFPSETSDPTLLTKDHQLSDQFIGAIDPSQKALLSVGSFDLSQLHVNQQNVYVNALIQAFKFNQLKVTNLDNNTFGLNNIDKFFAHRELQDFEFKGEATYKKRNTEQATANWDFQSKPGEIFTSDYNAKTNYTTFENIPVGDLWLSQLNFKAGDFHIYSAKNEKRPAHVDNIGIGGLRINHTTGELEVDEVRISNISANGLSINTQVAGWGFNTNIEQRASVNDIVLKGWKTKLDNPSAYGPQGRKATLDIGSVIVPKLAAELSTKEGAAGKVGTSGTIGKIRYTLYQSGAQSLRLRDLSLIGSEYNVSENAEFVNNFLNKVTAKEVMIEIDVHGRKSFLLKDPVISGYRFETNKLEVEADLYCQGDIRVYEGDYEAFVNAMPEALKAGKTGTLPPAGSKDAWLVDAAGCNVKLENMRMVHASWSSGQTAQQKALVETGIYQYKPLMLGGPGLADTPQNTTDILNRLKNSLQDQATEKADKSKEFDPDFERNLAMLKMIEHVNAEVYIRLGDAFDPFTVRNGEIDLDLLKIELSGIFNDAITTMDPALLRYDPQLQDVARQILSYLNGGVTDEVTLASSYLGALLGTLVGGLVAFVAPPAAPVAYALGFVIGAFLGVIIGLIGTPVVMNYFGYIVDLVRELCVNITANPGGDYRRPLAGIIEWAIKHLDVVNDNGTPYLNFIVDAEEAGTAESAITSFPIQPLGHRGDKHVDFKKKTINVYGLLKYIMEENKATGQPERQLLDRIRLLESQNNSAAQILEMLYETPTETTEQTPFQLNGLAGWLTGDGVFSGGSDLMPIGENILQDLLSGNLAIFAQASNISLTDMAQAINFDNDIKLRWLNYEKVYLSTYMAYNDNGGLADGTHQGRFSTAPISGFTMEEKSRKAMGFGDFQLPHLNFSSNTKMMNRETLTNSEFRSNNPGSVNGFQLAYRLDQKEKKGDNNAGNNSLGVKSPSIYPTYKNATKESDWALWEFSQLTGIKLTHLYIVDGDFMRYGDTWYMDLINDEYIKGQCAIGFIRHVDDKNNKIENYMGTLHADYGGGNRIFIPFTGKK